MRIKLNERSSGTLEGRCGDIEAGVLAVLYVLTDSVSIFAFARGSSVPLAISI